MTINEAREALDKNTLTQNEFVTIFGFVNDLINKHENELAIGEIAEKLNQVANQREFFTGLDLIVLDLFVVRAYCQTNYSWRAKFFASKTFVALDKYYENHEVDEYVAEYYETLGNYYVKISDQKSALRCYEKYYEYANKDESGNAFYHLLLCHKRLNPDYECSYSDEELKKMFTKDYERIKQVIENQYLKIDLIENSDDFQAVYDEVNEATQRRLEEEGRLYIVQQYWIIYAEELQKKGITWKNPGIMNPGVMFD